MTTLPDSSILLASLRGAVCPRCGERKRPSTSLCFACYGELPREMKNALYSKFGKGYEQALEAAIDRLGGGARFWPEFNEKGPL